MEIDFYSSEKTAQSEEAIAIIGIACRFPGANDYQQFWANLEQGVNSITEIPSNRWDIETFYSPTPDTPNKSISKWGGFIENADKFDAVFFGISPREATRMDPQQRLMLELSWSCIEDAGYSPTRFSGKPVGVFVGVCNFDYKELQEQHSQTVEGHNATGTYICMIPNRVSYLFNFHGPSVSVDTACSSSLVAVHQAVKSLQDGECEIALAGGISLLFTPTSYISFSQLGILSPEGKCKTFDGKADGYVRGEGAGLILLKPLAKAIEDQDHIYGVIKGSAVNHGGKARTLTYPNTYAQANVICDAYIKANISPDTVSYIETHGTGTKKGDLIEIEGLKQAFRQLNQQQKGEHTVLEQPYCGLGAVKTNIGHLEPAAGIAGLIKVILAMKHGKLPKNVNFQQLNPRIDLTGTPFYIISETQEWEPLKTKTGELIPRRASVSSFGFGGVNSHVVLEEVSELERQIGGVDRPQHLLTLSAKNEKALQELANRYAAFLLSQPEISLADICFTANTGREHFKYRLAVIAESAVQLQETLSAFAAGKETVEQVSAQVTNDNPPKIAFLFTGQGAQYPDMGRQLYETQPQFREIIDRCDRLLRPYLEMPLLEVLYPANGKHSPINETAYTQPALFAIEYALAQLWQSWGIKPDVVMGHSVGEYVAACVAGVFSLEDGLKLIAQRGMLMQSLPRDGEMVSVMASEAEVAELLAEEKLVAIAAINGPESVVISGKQEAVAAITATLTAKEIKTQKLAVSHAFHSPLMEPMLPDFERVAREVVYSQPKIDLISNVTGGLATDEITTPEYWCRHIRQPVRFAASMETLHQGGYELFLECGPKPILLGMGRKCLPEGVGVWLPSLRSGQKDWQQILLSLSELYVRGVAVDWLGFDRDYPRRKMALPTYPFQGERYWIETDANSDRTIKSDSQAAMTPTLKLLHQGNTELLISQLETSGNFSSQERKILPKLLEVLVKQHQQQLIEESKVDFSGQLPPDYLPAPTEVKAAIMPFLSELSPQPELLRELETLSVGYVVKAFEQMGWKFQLGQRFSTAKIAEQLGVSRQYHRLLGRLLEILANINLLKPSEQEWEVAFIPEIEEPQAHWQKLAKLYPFAEAELALLKRCGSRLAEVLQGTCYPLELLFPEGDLTTLTKLYQESPTFSSMNALVQKTVSALLKGLPQERGVRILEIGAGTGATTSYILPHLPSEQTKYIITDVGALFVKSLEQKFQSYPFVQYKVLDIEKTPEDQEFELNNYDIVLAANVLHATADLRHTLRHIKQLLAPGGMLVLLEGTDRRCWIDLIFGLIEGWWKFSDLDLRPNYPLLSNLKWQELLSLENGFQEVVTISSEWEQSFLFPQSVIVSQRVETISENEERFELLNQLQEVTGSDRYHLLVATIQKQIAKILRLNLGQIDPKQPINQMGLDSLMAIELRNAIKTHLTADIPMSKFLEGLSVADLANLANEQLNNIPSTPATSAPIIQKKDTQKTHPLSLGQQDLWFLSQLSPEPYAYNIPLTIHIYSPVDVGAMKKAFQILIDRHPALRTTFSQEEAEIVQKVHQSQEISFENIEASTWNEQEIQNGAIAAHQSPFDLEQGPLLRVKLFTRSPQHHLLVLTIHHLIMDGWSLWVILDELQQLYSAEISGREIALPPIQKDYLDFVYWERELLASSVGEQLWSYWEKELSGALPVVDLPTDRPRKAVQTYRGNCHAFKLTQNLTQKLHQLAREQGTTLYVTLLAAFFVMLYRYTSQSELMVGSISAGRTQSELANTVGTFINQVLLRASLSGNLKFTELIDQVRQTVLGAIAHQEYPFHLLAEKLQIQRQDYTRYQIFQVCFNLLKPQPGLEYLAELLASEVTETRLKWGELSVAPEKTQPLARFDLYVEAIEAKESLVVFLNYNQELFDPSTMARMAEHFETLLEGIVANPTQQIYQLPLLTAAEQNQLLVEWNATEKQDGNDKCIHHLFEAQVERTPDAVAVVFEEYSLTYEQLNSQANQLARHLQSLGVKPEVLVGISVERSLEMVVGLLAILKAGGAYVPLDPAYPQERLSYMLQDGAVSLLLTQEKLLSNFPELSIPVVCLDNCWQDRSQLSTANLASGVNCKNLAYVIYTSGSTGKPKGVMIEHQSLVNFIQAVLAEYGTNPSDRVLQFTSISFDVAAEEIYSCLSCGATLVLRTDEMLTSITTFIQKCRDWQVSVLYPPTAYWHQLVNELENSNLVLPDSWRIVTIGGEPALPQKIKAWQEIVGDKIQLINSYGPTETTIEATLYKVPGLASADKYWPEVPIGRPLANTELYILDCDRQLVPIGVPGELHIGGKGLARGYLNRPELTAEKFIPHPFRPGERLYKTGDLVCYLPDGMVNFLGRLDEQVKIRGYRVELGEIEQVLAQHSGVRETVVIVREDVPGDKRLVAYLVPNREDLSTQELRQYLLQKLPEYMVPTAFVALEAMPLTPTGKVNRRILPVPSSDRQSLSEGFVAARDSLELQLTQIWLEVLNLQTVGVRDNFFELGGNSLIALRLMSEIQQQFGKNLPLATLFQSSTIEQQADLISQNNDSLPWSPLVTIQPKGTKPPIFCVPGIGGNVIYFYDLASQLGGDRPFYALQALGLDGESQPHQRIEDMAACYIKAMQAVQPLGPYILVGHSFGSWVAFEIAKQLKEQEHEIALLAVIDFWAPMRDNNSSGVTWDDAKLLTRIAKQIKHLSGTNLEISFEKLVDLEPEEKLNYFKKQLQKVNLLPQKAGTLPIKGMLQVYKSCLQVSYFPENINPTSINIFRAIDGFPDWAEIEEPFALKQNVSWGWENFSLSSVDIHWVPGDHYTLLSKPHVRVLAEKLKACLDKLPGSI